MSTSTRTSSDLDLAAAREQIQADRLDDALTALLRVWARRPGSRLADLILAVSARATAGSPPSAELRGKRASALASWRARAERATPLEVPSLLECLTDVSAKDARARMALVEAWPADPRVDEALVRIMETVPYRATSTQPFWRRVVARLRSAPDARLVARLEALDDRYENDLATTMATWLRAELAKLLAVLRGARSSGEPDEADLADLEASVSAIGVRQRAAGRELESLLAAIHEQPEDDELRLVYADALADRGDPRGELITLQCRLAEGEEAAALRRRERQLLAAHGKTWLGALAPVIMSGYTFERGFLASCRVDRRKRDLVRELASDPAWSTVRRLSGSAVIALQPSLRALRSLHFDTWTLDEEGVPDAWRDLLLEHERPLEELEYRGVRAWRGAAEELEALCACRALPRLRSLRVHADVARVAEPLLRSTVIQRLQVLHVRFDASRPALREPLAAFAAALAAAPVERLAFTLDHIDFHPTEVSFERGPGGYETMSLELGPTTTSPGWSGVLATEAIAILATVPPSVRVLRLAARKNMTPTELSRVRTVASDMQGLEVVDVNSR